MLERIPSISPVGLDAHFCSIDSMLSAYDSSTMLELAIWKSKIEEQTDGDINLLPPDMKMGCRNDSQSTVGIICRRVLPFLRSDANEGDDGDEDDDGDDDEDDGDDEFGDDDSDDNDSDEEDDDRDEDDEYD